MSPLFDRAGAPHTHIQHCKCHSCSLSEYNTVLSTIRRVSVSQGDVSDFQHIQGVVGDFIAV